MPCTVRLQEEPRRIELLFTGAISDDDARLGFTEGLRLAREHDLYRVLADTSAATSDPSVFALFDIASELAAIGVTDQLLRRYREAVVVAPAGVTLEGAKFYEDAMVNRGLVARMFDDRGAALAWLGEQPI